MGAERGGSATKNAAAVAAAVIAAGRANSSGGGGAKGKDGRSGKEDALLWENIDLLASISKDGTVKLWNFDNEDENALAQQHTYKVSDGQDGWPSCLAFSNDDNGALLAVGCINNTIVIYSTTGTYQKLREIRVQNSGILSLRWRPQNDALLVGTVDGTVQRIPLNPPDAKDGHHHRK